MKMATEVKNGVTKDEVNLITKALGALKASIMRAKTKEIKDDDMVAIYDKRIADIDKLINRVTTKELF